jgi:hypothetical protein
MKNHKILDIDGVAFFMKLFVDITTFQNRSILQILMGTLSTRHFFQDISNMLFIKEAHYLGRHFLQ